MTDGTTPAYPHAGTYQPDWPGNGLTKREYFAAKAMQGLLASLGQHDVTDYYELASDAVLAADALIHKLNAGERI